MLKDLSLEGIILIINALDKYIKNLHQLLDFIAKPFCIKQIIFSYNWLLIKEKLGKVKQKVRLQLKLNEDLISAAIYIYIWRKVDKLALNKEYN